jgi:hypothetical protein
MYRPTVRYNEVFKDYVDDVYQATFLDRNQVLRLALFVAAHTDTFKQVINEYKRPDVPLPSPCWELWEYGYWRGATYKHKKREVDVNDDNRRKNDATIINEKTSPGRNTTQENRHIEPEARRSREIPTQRISRNAAGGIRITIG